MRIIGFDELAGLVGEELGVGDWLRVDQRRIDDFAETTDDRQWIHVDPERAADGPFGTTVAHGYLTLALLPHLTRTAYAVSGVGTRVNYGLDRVRFPSPLPVDARIRDRAALLAVEPTARGARIAVRNSIEIEGRERPACIADTITLLVRAEGAS